MPAMAAVAITMVCALFPLGAAAAAGVPGAPAVIQSERAPQGLMPGGLNMPGAFEGVMPPRGLKKYDWQPELVFFADTFSGLPALAVSGRRGKSGFLAIFEHSKLPRIDHEALFLRSAGVPVGTYTQSTLVNGVSTATYTTDLVGTFRTRTALLDLFYYRTVYEREFARVGLLAGVPLVWNTYEISATLSDGSAFDEKKSAAGAGLAGGVAVTFGSASMVKSGFVGSLFLIYNKYWFAGHDGELARHLRSRLNGPRFGFSAGWRFNFY